MVNGNIKAGIYKDYAYVYYVRITDNTGYSQKLLCSILKAIERKLDAKHIGVKSKGHGKFNRPHIHALLLAKNKADLHDLLKLIPQGFSFKIWRVKTYSDFQSAKKYIKEHIGKKKRGFLLKVEILAGRILRRLLRVMKLMLRIRKLNLSLVNSQAHQSADLRKKLKEVRLWKE